VPPSVRSVHSPGPAERFLPPFVGTTIRDGRHRLGITQSELARRAGVSQATISRVERGLAAAIPLATAGRLMDGLEIRLEASARPPLVAGGPTEHDAIHVRVLTYAERRLRARGFETAREVPIGADRVRGWLDLLAWRPDDRVAILIEIKGDIHDVGAFERQISWYEREAWAATRRLGWRPARVVVGGLVLASEHNAAIVRAHGEALRRRFPTPAVGLESVLSGATPGGPLRALAFVDPLRRGRSWLLPTPLFGGRPIVPYVAAPDLRARLAPGERRAVALPEGPRGSHSPGTHPAIVRARNPRRSGLIRPAAGAFRASSAPRRSREE
jgi:transcriptional regulator with XRE-family HTH domain